MPNRNLRRETDRLAGLLSIDPARTLTVTAAPGPEGYAVTMVLDGRTYGPVTVNATGADHAQAIVTQAIRDGTGRARTYRKVRDGPVR